MSNRESAITVEILGRRLWANLRLLAGIGGLLLVCAGAYNLLVAPAIGVSTVAPYRVLGVIQFERGAYYMGDVALIALGSVIAWLS